MNRVKRSIEVGFVLILLVILLTGCSSENSANSMLNVADGIQLGMSPKEVVNAAQNAKKSLTANVLYETAIADQPFSYVYLDFIDDTSEFSSTKSNKAITKIIVNGLAFNLSLGALDSGLGVAVPDNAKEDAETKLVQASVYFTADKKYTTAIDTFDAVEGYLTKKYGETRYTSRRGDSLPVIDGYESLDSAVVTQECELPNGNMTSPVPYYSQRIVKVDDQRYVVIDHHITLNESKNTFSHIIVYTLIPENIEK